MRGICEIMYISIASENFIAVNTAIENIVLDEENALRVVKAQKIYEFDENTYAKVKDFEFENGVIEVDMKSRLLPDAPDIARGFIGIAFGIDDKDSELEAFYIRPTNSVNATSDPIRQSHGCQYFSYPKYTFAYFRENGITGYEAAIHNELDQWVHLKAVIEGDRASFYLNNEEQATLTVEHLIHGKAKPGSIGFFVDIGTEAFFKNLIINR